MMMMKCFEWRSLVLFVPHHISPFYALFLLSSFLALGAYYGTPNGALINEYTIYHSVCAFLHVIVVIIKLTFFRHCCELPLSPSLAHLLCFIIRWQATKLEYLLINH